MENKSSQKVPVNKEHFIEVLKLKIVVSENLVKHMKKSNAQKKLFADA